MVFAQLLGTTNLGLSESIASWGLCVASELTHPSITLTAKADGVHKRKRKAFSGGIPRFSISAPQANGILLGEDKPPFVHDWILVCTLPEMSLLFGTRSDDFSSERPSLA
jgi:hypothetical protein